MSTSSQDLPNKDNFVYKYSSKNSKNGDEEGEDSSIKTSSGNVVQSSSNEGQNNGQIQNNDASSEASQSQSQIDNSLISGVHNPEHVYSMDDGNTSKDILIEAMKKLVKTDPKKTG